MISIIDYLFEQYKTKSLEELKLERLVRRDRPSMIVTTDHPDETNINPENSEALEKGLKKVSKAIIWAAANK